MAGLVALVPFWADTKRGDFSIPDRHPGRVPAGVELPVRLLVSSFCLEYVQSQ
jgi:hypothetical protein